MNVPDARGAGDRRGAGLRMRRRVPRRHVQRRAAPPAPARQGPGDRGGRAALRTASPRRPWRHLRRRRDTRPPDPVTVHSREADYRRVTMTDPVPQPAPRLLGDGAAAFEAAVDAPATRAGRPPVRHATRRCGRPIRGSRRRIADRLGWLDAPGAFRRPGRRPRGVRRRASSRPGFTTAVVAGMGGSSLAPDVLHRTFGIAGRLADLRVLDSTDPAAVAATVDDLDPLTTLSSSPRNRARRPSRTRSWPTPGTRTSGARRRASPRATRPGRAHRRDHRPGPQPRGDPPPRRAARGVPQPARHRRPLLGADVRRARAGVADRAGPRRAARPAHGDARRAAASRIRRPIPGCRSASRIGTLAQGRPRQADVPRRREIASFGAWAEQLIAESTGKRGVGHRPRRPRAARRGRRLRLGPRLRAADPRRCAATDGRSRDDLATALEAAGHPVHPDRRSPTRSTSAPSSCAGRWRPRSPAPCSGIDPFDQPNVEEAKELTRDVLARHETATATAPQPPRRSSRPDGLALHGDAPLRLTRTAAARRRRARAPPRPPAAERAISRSRHSSRRPRRATTPSPGSGRCCATGRGRRRPPATARASSTPPASSTRAARRSAGSSS